MLQFYYKPVKPTPKTIQFLGFIVQIVISVWLARRMVKGSSLAKAS